MTRIREARENCGMSQKEVALSIGVSAPFVWAWESGKSKPTAANLEALSNLYHVSIDWLMSNDNQKEAPPKGLDDSLIDMLVNLPPNQVQRVRDFVLGLKAAEKE